MICVVVVFWFLVESRHIEGNAVIANCKFAKVVVPGHCGEGGRDSRTPLMVEAGAVSLMDIMATSA